MKQNNPIVYIHKTVFILEAVFLCLYSKEYLLNQFAKACEGETPFLEKAKASLFLCGPSQKCGRANRATSVASSYPSREPIGIAAF